MGKIEDISAETIVNVAFGFAMLAGVIYLFIAFNVRTWPKRFRAWLWAKDAKFWLAILSVIQLMVCPFLAVISAHAGWLAFGSAVTLLVLAAIVDEERSYTKHYGTYEDSWLPKNERSYRSSGYGYYNAPRKQPDEEEYPAPLDR